MREEGEACGLIELGIMGGPLVILLHKTMIIWCSSSQTMVLRLAVLRREKERQITTTLAGPDLI